MLPFLLNPFFFSTRHGITILMMKVTIEEYSLQLCHSPFHLLLRNPSLAFVNTFLINEIVSYIKLSNLKKKAEGLLHLILCDSIPILYHQSKSFQSLIPTLGHPP